MRVVLVSVLLGISLAGSSVAADFESLAARAEAAFEARRFEEAISIYQQALELRPDWQEGRWFLASALFQVERYAEAVPVLRVLTEAAPRAGGAWILLGVSEYRLGRYRGALEHLRQGLSRGANEELLSTARYYLALLMNRAGEFEAAIQLLTPFALEGNQSPTVIEAFGLAILRRKWLPSEIPADERSKIERAGRGAFFMASRQAEKGRSEMVRLLEEHPDDPNVRYAYGAMLIESDPEAAKAELRKVLEAQPDDYRAWLTLGTLANKERRFEAALENVGKALELRPDSLLARYQKATALLGKGDAEQARVLLEGIVEEAHEFIGAHVSLATAYYRLGRKQEGDREREIVRQITAARQAGQPGAAGTASRLRNGGPR